MDREAWRATVHGVAESRTRLSDWTELNWTEESKHTKMSWIRRKSQDDNIYLLICTNIIIFQFDYNSYFPDGWRDWTLFYGYWPHTYRSFAHFSGLFAYMLFPLIGNASGRELSWQWKWHKRRRSDPWEDPWVRKIPPRRKWQPTPVFLPGKCHGQRILAGYTKLDMTEVT